MPIRKEDYMFVLFALVVVICCQIETVASWYIGGKITKLNDFLHSDFEDDVLKRLKRQRTFWIATFALVQFFVAASILFTANVLLVSPV